MHFGEQMRTNANDDVVPLAGLEPARCCHHLILSQARLPIPPQGPRADYSGGRPRVNAGFTLPLVGPLWGGSRAQASGVGVGVWRRASPSQRRIPTPSPYAQRASGADPPHKGGGYRPLTPLCRPPAFQACRLCFKPLRIECREAAISAPQRPIRPCRRPVRRCSSLRLRLRSSASPRLLGAYFFQFVIGLRRVRFAWSSAIPYYFAIPARDPGRPFGAARGASPRLIRGGLATSPPS